MRVTVGLGVLLGGLFMVATAQAELTFSTVTGAGGVPLSVVETGNKQAPAILFIHGFSQSYLSWEKQLNDPDLQKRFHLIAFDLRGHGASGKPSDPAAYSPEAWADDLANVIAATGNRKPVLVPWSMGGAVVFKYLLVKGGKAIAGVDQVAGAAGLGAPGLGAPPPATVDPAAAEFRAAMAGMRSNDIAANLAGTRAFVASLTAKPLPAAEMETILVYNMLTPAYVRVAMGQAPAADYAALRGKITVPFLLTHGDKDAVIAYQTSVATKPEIPGATLSTYQGIGHAPFLEDPVRFNRELAAFVIKVNGR